MNFYDWITQKYLTWQQELGERKSVSAFAKYLDMPQPSVSAWLQPDGRIPRSPQAISKLAHQLGVEVYEILGYEIPEEDHPLNYAPEVLRSQFDTAVKIANQRLLSEFKDGHFFTNDEAARVIAETLAEYGFSLDETAETDSENE